jgi:hypothetical protein
MPRKKSLAEELAELTTVTPATGEGWGRGEAARARAVQWRRLAFWFF